MTEGNSATPVPRRSSDTKTASDQRSVAAIDVPEKVEKSDAVAADEKSDGSPDEKEKEDKDEKDGSLKDYFVSCR